MNPSRIDKIRDRSLTAAGRRSIEALARRAGEEDETGAEEQPAAARPPEQPAANTPKPDSIMDITKHYFVTFREHNDDATAAALTQAAMQLEGAALIAKTIRDAHPGARGEK